MLYDKDREYVTVADYNLFAVDIYEHAAATFLVYLDLFVSATPIRVAHVIYGLLYGIVYISFSVIYWYLDGTTPWGNSALYSILDWDTPVNTCYYVAGSAGVVILMHLLGYILYKSRICIYNCCCTPKAPTKQCILPKQSKPPKQPKPPKQSKPTSQQSQCKPPKDSKPTEKPFHSYFVLTTIPLETEGGTFEQAPLARAYSTEL